MNERYLLLFTSAVSSGFAVSLALAGAVFSPGLFVGLAVWAALFLLTWEQM